MLSWLKRIYFVYSIDIVPVYMLTTGEEIVIDILFLTIMGLLISATVAYLPQHAQTVTKRMYYYYSGQNLLA